MKNIANCKPSEFLAQTYKMKSLVSKFFAKDDIAKIRARMPQIEPIPSNASDEEVARITRENAQRMRNTAKKNAMEILDIAMSVSAEDTLALLALACFVEPEAVDEHPMSFYFDSIGELMGDASVIRFFTSLAQLGTQNGQGASAK